MKQSHWILLIIASIISIIISIFLLQYAQNTLLIEDEIDISIEEDILEETESETYSVQYVAVGDNLIHGRIYWEAQQRTSDSSYDFSYCYENIASYISSADIASINQETMMDSSQEPSHYPLFNSPTELAYELSDIGFDIINIANNHMFDMGTSGLLNTIDFLNIFEEFNVIGAYTSEQNQLEIIKENNIDFIYLGATEVTNGFSLDTSYGVSTNIVNDDAGQNEFLELVSQANTLCDIVVVNIHWGVEYTNTPTDFQYTYAQQLVDAGADIIIGHHPHVIQPIEILTDTQGNEAIVAYSLGNFFSAQDSGPTMIGGLLSITIEKKDDEITFTSCTFNPVITHFTSGTFNLTNYLYCDYTDELAKAHGVIEYTPTFSLSYIYEYVSNVIDPIYLPEDFYLLYT